MNFKKNKKATKKENICEREDEERQNVELDESCSDHEPGATIDEEPEGKRMILKARNWRFQKAPAKGNVRRTVKRKPRESQVGDRCPGCGMTEPPRSVHSAKQIAWTECDDANECRYWYHVVCVGNSTMPSSDNDQFVCPLCIESK